MFYISNAYTVHYNYFCISHGFFVFRATASYNGNLKCFTKWQDKPQTDTVPENFTGSKTNHGIFLPIPVSCLFWHSGVQMTAYWVSLSKRSQFNGDNRATGVAFRSPYLSITVTSGISAERPNVRSRGRLPSHYDNDGFSLLASSEDKPLHPSLMI